MSVEPRRAVRPVLAWSVAAVAAVALSSWGVALVGRSVTDSRPAPLSAAQVEERLAASSATTTSAPGDPATTAPLAPGEQPTAPVESPATTAADPTAPSGPAPGAAAPPTTIPSAAPATTAAPPATAAPPPPPAPAGETRTYTMVGGTVSLRFEATGVTVVFANPAAGFEVEVEPEHANGVKVEFESETHRSRVTGWWDGGPRDEREERADSD